MKNMLFALTFMSSSLTFAATLKSICISKAEGVVASFAANQNYDKNGFQTIRCSIAQNRKAMLCDVSASKGGGDAMDTYRVVMNSNCTKAFRVELISEE